jgi:hypothetical protein
VKVVRVEKAEFELENRDVFPINPPLKEDMTPDEFQEHYDRACNLVVSVQAARGDGAESQEVVRRRQAEDHTD